jgi:hypothetical protein
MNAERFLKDVLHTHAPALPAGGERDVFSRTAHPVRAIITEGPDQ